MKPNNVADLIQLQLSLHDAADLAVTAVLETLTGLQSTPVTVVVHAGANQLTITA